MRPLDGDTHVHAASSCRPRIDPRAISRAGGAYHGQLQAVQRLARLPRYIGAVLQRPGRSNHFLTPLHARDPAPAIARFRMRQLHVATPAAVTEAC